MLIQNSLPAFFFSIVKSHLLFKALIRFTAELVASISVP
jgi:hypothetical protein